MKKEFFGLGLIRSLVIIAVVAAVVAVIGTRLAEGEPPPPRVPSVTSVPTEQSISPFAGGGRDGTEAEVQIVRWVDVTVAVPGGSGLSVTRGFWGPESDPPAIFIRSLDNGDSVIVIDAETGRVIVDHIEPEHRPAVDQVLKTMTVSALDRSAAAWPYSGEPPNVPRERKDNITFSPPDAASGISVRIQVGDGTGSPSTFLRVTNGRSVFWINTATGDASYDEAAVIAPEDKDAFDRFLSDVALVGP